MPLEGELPFSVMTQNPLPPLVSGITSQITQWQTALCRTTQSTTIGLTHLLFLLCFLYLRTWKGALHQIKKKYLLIGLDSSVMCLCSPPCIEWPVSLTVCHKHPTQRPFLPPFKASSKPLLWSSQGVFQFLLPLPLRPFFLFLLFSYSPIPFHLWSILQWKSPYYFIT